MDSLKGPEIWPLLMKIVQQVAPWRGRFLISLAKTFYGFTKSLKGLKSAVLMKLFYQVAPWGRRFQYIFVKICIVSLKGVKTAPSPNKCNLPETFPLAGKILVLFSENIVCFTKKAWNLPTKNENFPRSIPWGGGQI